MIDIVLIIRLHAISLIVPALVKKGTVLFFHKTSAANNLKVTRALKNVISRSASDA